MTPVLFDIVQGDFGFDWKFTLTDAQGNALSLAGNPTLTFQAQLDSDLSVNFANPMTIINPTSAGTCKYTPLSTDFQVAGTYNAQIKVAFGSGETVSFSGIVITVEPKIPIAG